MLRLLPILPGTGPWNDFMSALEIDGPFPEQPLASSYGLHCRVGAGRRALALPGAMISVDPG